MAQRAAIVTGASSGIGLATARQAAARGARVVLTARDAGNLQPAIDEIRHGGGRAIAVAADVCDKAQVEEIGATAVREFGRIDTWVNNAAVSLHGRITQLSKRPWRSRFR